MEGASNTREAAPEDAAARHSVQQTVPCNNACYSMRKFLILSRHSSDMAGNGPLMVRPTSRDAWDSELVKERSAYPRDLEGWASPSQCQCQNAQWDGPPVSLTMLDAVHNAAWEVRMSGTTVRRGDEVS